LLSHNSRKAGRESGTFESLCLPAYIKLSFLKSKGRLDFWLLDFPFLFCRSLFELISWLGQFVFGVHI
jgi:hypothetical protein